MEDYVTFEQAVKLKSLGFDWKCNHFYDGKHSNEFIELSYYHNFNHNGASQDYSAPSLSQAQKWLREVKNIGITVRVNGFGADSDIFEIIYAVDVFKINTDKKCLNLLYGTTSKSYEQSLLAGIDKALELLK